MRMECFVGRFGDEDVKHEHCCSPLCVFQLAASRSLRHNGYSLWSCCEAVITAESRTHSCLAASAHREFFFYLNTTVLEKSERLYPSVCFCMSACWSPLSSRVVWIYFRSQETNHRLLDQTAIQFSLERRWLWTRHDANSDTEYPVKCFYLVWEQEKIPCKHSGLVWSLVSSQVVLSLRSWKTRMAKIQTH